MASESQQLPRREDGITNLWVRHLDAELGFAFPLVGPSTYAGAGAGVLKRGQAVPNGDEVASLLHAIHCDESTKNWPENQTVRDAMRKNWFWAYQNDVWMLQGVYVVRDPEAKGTAMPFDVTVLEGLLEGGETKQGVRFSKDGAVRFAPRESYKLGEHTPDSFAIDGFVVASCGVEGAKKLAEVAGTFEYTPRTWGVEVGAGKPSVQRLSAVDDYGGRGVGLYGGCTGSGGDGCASGVLKSAPKARA